MIQFAQIFNKIRHKYIEHYFALSFFLYIVTFLFQLSKINQLTKLVYFISLHKVLISSILIHYDKKYIKKVWLKFGKYIFCGVYLYKQKQTQ